MEGSCTIYFEDPFWVGVFERKNEEGYSVARYVFGSEPGDAEFHLFILEHYNQLQFSQSITATLKKMDEMGFKRRQREVKRILQQTGIGTWAHRAARAEQERNKKERIADSREIHDAEEQQKFLIKQERKKQKHKGR